MIISHNMEASFTKNQLNITKRRQSASSRKLSSGYRINQASDDAAGLAISEEMRAQIRGLNRGAQNTSEGISMINTAEGGITEQISMIQRMRELTVQSYNDTYTQEDRIQIQAEVDELSTEIDRIAKATEFNTIKVLQGLKTVEETHVVPPSTQYHEEYYLISEQKQFPAWAIHGSQLTIGGASAGAVQDTSQVTFIEDDTNMKVTVYGPQSQAQAKMRELSELSVNVPNGAAGFNNVKYYDGYTFEYGGSWSASLSDNYATTVDFSAIANAVTVNDLYGYLNDLTGAGLLFDCDTCSDYQQGFVFETKAMEVVTVLGGIDDNKSTGLKKGYNGFYSERSEIGVINLDKCFDAVSKIYSQDAYDAVKNDAVSLANMPPAERALLGNSYSDYLSNVVPETARKVAEMVTKSVLDKTRYSTHFMRITSGTNNPYSIVAYDYRDSKAVGIGLTPNVTESVPLRLKATVQVENDPLTLTEIKEEGYWIQSGANSMQGVVIDFPDTSLDALDLQDYTVFKDGYCDFLPGLAWDDTILQKADKIDKNTYRINIGGTERMVNVTHTEVKHATRQVMVEVPARVPITRYNQYGEAYTDYIDGKRQVPTTVIDASIPPTTITYTTTRREIVGGTDIIFHAYQPDTLLRLDRALQNLSLSRSQLGARYNQLEHEYSNDLNASENLQDSESKIRDTDVAEEMVLFAKENILEQAGVSMLAQANSSREGILQLLR